MFRFISSFFAMALLVIGPASAQGHRLRTPQGTPSLEGLWTIASRTELERPPGLSALTLTDSEAAAFAMSLPSAPAVAKGSPVGQAETEWWEMGEGLARLDGKARTSWVIDPPDGQLPYSPAGLAALQARQRAVMTRFDDPEGRPASERCLASPGGSSGPPLLNTFYNNLIRIVQTRDAVVIIAEMAPGPRILSLSGSPAPPGPAWGGLSSAHWEGDTLVVVSRGFQPGESWRAPSRLYLSPDAVVTERFTRTAQDEIRYGFSIEDPATFTRPWRAEIPLKATPGPMFEYTCHEGNYSMTGVLAGGREAERLGKSP